METSISKIKNGTSHYIQTAYRSYKTHSFILKQEQPPQCLTCQTPYTIKHILMKCAVLATARDGHFKTDNMRDLFENINMDDVLSFLREAELYLKI